MIYRLTLLAAAFMTIAAAPAPKWTLVIHGGAGVIERARIKPEQDKAIRDALARSWCGVHL
jgi:L-asparaginase / beta-aspartyl-peptidase